MAPQQRWPACLGEVAWRQCSGVGSAAGRSPCLGRRQAQGRCYCRELHHVGPFGALPCLGHAQYSHIVLHIESAGKAMQVSTSGAGRCLSHALQLKRKRTPPFTYHTKWQALQPNTDLGSGLQPSQLIAGCPACKGQRWAWRHGAPGFCHGEHELQAGRKPTVLVNCSVSSRAMRST